MKCINPNCGGEWMPPCGKSLTVCPFCQEPIVGGKKTAQSFDNLADTLVYIKEQHGVEMLLGEKVYSLFADLTRNQFRDEKELMKQLQEKGALGCLKAAVGKPEPEHEFAIKRALAKLPKYLQDSPAVSNMLLCFAEALGWKILTPRYAVQNQLRSGQDAVISQSGASAGGGIIVAPLAGSVIHFAGMDWRVLTVENEKALLLSEKILEKRPYTIESDGTAWEACTLRQYLNHDFYNKLGAAKSAIAETHNDNPGSYWYGTCGGNETTDKIFLLSNDEADRYFGNSGDYVNNKRKDYAGETDSGGYCVYNAYNQDRIAAYGNEGPCWWWLRSPGRSSYRAACVESDGYIYVFGQIAFSGFGGVRPALWLKLY
jgi:hypothetical protein